MKHQKGKSLEGKGKLASKKVVTGKSKEWKKVKRGKVRKGKDPEVKK
jgi:hypothetical protein